MLILGAFAGFNSDLFAENTNNEEVPDAVIEGDEDDEDDDDEDDEDDDDEDFPVLP